MTSALFLCAALSVIDGDSIRCDGQNLRLLGDGAPFVAGVDAPEVRGAECLAERMLARKASERLEELIALPGMQVWDTGEVDRGDRPLVRVMLPDGKTAGQTLIDEGLALEWSPGVSLDWCGPT